MSTRHKWALDLNVDAPRRADLKPPGDVSFVLVRPINSPKIQTVSFQAYTSSSSAYWQLLTQFYARYALFRSLGGQIPRTRGGSDQFKNQSSSPHLICPFLSLQGISRYSRAKNKYLPGF